MLRGSRNLLGRYGGVPMAANTTTTSPFSLILPSTPTTTTIRYKHSHRQIKRFQNHPARLRVEKRMGIDRTPLPMDPPKYPPVLEPIFLPNGWSPPPQQTPDYPFGVARTKNKPHDAIGFLPVYSNFRKDGARVTTRVKKVTGDRDLFIRELRSVLELPPPKNGNARLDPIRVRVGGTIEVKGNRTREIKAWLAGLGF
ncbi:Mitochondrial large subunit ribosomal protein (Img2) [Seminavis robusta]|uniref:Large ribosomal subunit protein mL49 n=1 Tax=Seminavis robusta TaxID=568900 RepID=A0A9N8DJ04_9STRA|nr:Mitochondrial large subunit ribosomal protein (Img2) [Seminavis robusta]|eukprot:Sro154_g070150.1 Mitochondrial large subunit ribosomal protein (Img2) (198) ;mRNA; f:80760-81565